MKKKMKIAYLGTGTWGTCLASLLARKGHEVKAWDCNSALLKLLDEKRSHPKLAGSAIPSSVRYVEDLKETLTKVDLIVESVTGAGIRPVLEQVHTLIGELSCPLVLTSKGIEQTSCLLFPEVALDVFGKKSKKWIGCLSGPSHAEEVVRDLPASVVSASFEPAIRQLIRDIFSTHHFRIYPNADVLGVSFGGAMKNIIAIACGISDGLHFGDSAKAALMTRGLHEMRKLSKTKKCKPETLNGLSGLGDLCVTCLSTFSRNYSFGRLIAEGFSAEEAKKKIGMVVEGAYTCVSAMELGQKYRIPIPITEATYAILYQGMAPQEAVKALFQREVKEEGL